MRNSPTGSMIKQVSQNAQIKIIFALLWTGNRVLGNFLTVQLQHNCWKFVFFLAHICAHHLVFLFFLQQHLAGNKERDAPRRETTHTDFLCTEATYPPLCAGATRDLSIMQIIVLAARSPQMTTNLRSKQGNSNELSKISRVCLQTIDLIFNLK